MQVQTLRRFSSRCYRATALCLNLIGTILLYASFQATSSDLRIVTDAATSAVSLCINGRDFLTGRFDFAGFSIHIGGGACPNWISAKPAAVVSVEHPLFISIGFFAIVLGFAIQALGTFFPDIPTKEELVLKRRQIETEIRALELEALQKQGEQRKREEAERELLRKPVSLNLNQGNLDCTTKDKS